MDAPADQSLGWHLWQVSVTPCHPRQGRDKGIAGTPQPWLAAPLGEDNSKK